MSISEDLRTLHLKHRIGNKNLVSVLHVQGPGSISANKQLSYKFTLLYPMHLIISSDLGSMGHNLKRGS